MTKPLNLDQQSSEPSPAPPNKADNCPYTWLLTYMNTIIEGRAQDALAEFLRTKCPQEGLTIARQLRSDYRRSLVCPAPPTLPWE